MKNKICNICKTAIDTDNRYAKFYDMKNDTEINSKAYYHIECFRNRLNAESKQVASHAIQFIKDARAKIGLDTTVKI